MCTAGKKRDGWGDLLSLCYAMCMVRGFLENYIVDSGLRQLSLFSLYRNIKRQKSLVW